MAGFPDIPLDLQVEMALGADLTADPSTWVWTPLGNDTVLGQPRLLADPITIQRGTAVGASSAQTTSATIKVLNNDGWLTPMLATSPWWPYIDAGTPIRLRMKSRTDLVDTFSRGAVSGIWGSADTGEAWTTSAPGSSSANLTGAGGNIAFTAVSNTARSVRSTRTDIDADITWDAAVSQLVTGSGGSASAAMRLRQSGGGTYALLCEILFYTGGTVYARISRVFNGSTYVGAAQVLTGVTQVAGTAVRARAQVVGAHVRMKVWSAAGTEPASWMLDFVQTDNLKITGYNAARTATDTIAAYGWASSMTNTTPFTITYDNITIAQYQAPRVEGYIADVQPTFLPQTGGTTWSTVAIQIAGVGSRLEKNQSPSYSPLRRSIQLSDPPPIAYWPCEDDQGALSATSAFPQQPAMTVTGPAVFGFAASAPSSANATPGLSRYGTKTMVSLAAGAQMTGIVPVTAVTNQWAISFSGEFNVPGVPLSSMRVLAWDTPGGTFNRWALIGLTNGYVVRGYNDNTATTTDIAVYSAATFVGLLTYTVEAEQSGSNINVRLYANDVLIGSGSATGTLTAVTRLVANPDRTNVTASVDPYGIRLLVGHIRVGTDTSLADLPYYIDPDTGNSCRSDYAWYLESAHRRLNRLCDEEAVPFTWVGNPQGDGLTILNAQQDGSFTDLITRAVESESGGLLYEDGFGYTYLPRAMRYNQPPALSVDMATYCYSDGTDPGDILVPQLDSRATNYWTVTRTDGSSGSDAAPAAYRQLKGTIAEEVTVDVLSDADLPDHASWRTHLSVDSAGANYPSMPLDLAANPGLIDAWLACSIGSRVWRINQPSIAGIGTIDQVIEGISETISPTSWDATLSCSPGDVWDVATYDGASRYDSASTVTNTSYAAGVPTIVFKTTNKGDIWSTTAVPYTCVCAGEQFTVTAMGAASGTGPYLQSATVTRAVNGIPKTLPAGSPISKLTAGRPGL